MRLRPSTRNSLLLGAMFLSLATPSMAQIPGPCGDEICPGRIRNPDGRQYFMGAAFNSEQDDYLLTYSNGAPLSLRLGTDGNIIGSEIVIGPNTTVQETVIAYNPGRNGYLMVYRNDSPTEIFARYLDGNGQPMGSAFFISNGVDPKIAFSSLHDRYMVTFTRYVSGSPGVRYQMVEGDSTAPSKLIGGQVTAANAAVSVRVAYGSVSDKFLIAYGKEFGGAEKGGVIGHFVTGDGSSLGSSFGIALGIENQGNPEIAYANSNDRWLVSLDDWNTGGGFPKISAHFVDSDGTVGARMNLTPGDSDWDVPGPITYVESVDTFVATWFVAVWARARTVDPLDGAIGDVIDWLIYPPIRS